MCFMIVLCVVYDVGICVDVGGVVLLKVVCFMGAGCCVV